MVDISLTPTETEERQFFAVRCCRQPTKVIGFLLLPKHGGDRRVVQDCEGRNHHVEIKTIFQAGQPGMQYTQLGVPVGGEPDSAIVAFHEKAIYSEERGEDFWRTIPGFMRVVTAEFITTLLGGLSK